MTEAVAGVTVDAIVAVNTVFDITLRAFYVKLLCRGICYFRPRSWIVPVRRYASQKA
jgi:hypothetical protein